MPGRTQPSAPQDNKDLPASSARVGPSDEQGLLAAIRANPADDTARLVYAD
jgi:hypothetical protein